PPKGDERVRFLIEAAICPLGRRACVRGAGVRRDPHKLFVAPSRERLVAARGLANGFCRSHPRSPGNMGKHLQACVLPNGEPCTLSEPSSVVWASLSP